MDAAPAKARRVILHVGAPKTGTTFLQRALWKQRAALLEQRVTCPGTRERDMFHAAVEVRESFGFWGLDPEALTGTWQRLSQEARSFRGTTIMSHELLGAATRPQIARALADLEGEEIHLVLTVRDLARQVTSEWQERVKNGGMQSFKQFARGISRQIEHKDFSAGFWRAQDPVHVLNRWGEHVPPERVHVVVCPPRGGAPEELWYRFGDACGFDARALELPEMLTRNKGLGAPQASVLRRVNKALDGRIPQPQYGGVVKHQFSQQLLARFEDPGPQCPPELVAQLSELTQRRNDVLRARGYRIHGDLDELLPLPTGATPTDVRPLGPRQERDAAVAIIAELLVQRAEEQASRMTITDPRLRDLARRAVGRMVPRRGRRTAGPAQ
jgi:hypothetical protein